MFETLFRQKAALRRHRTGPLTVERERYLQHCANQGATDGEQRKRAKCLLWIAKRMWSGDRRGVNAARLHTIVYRRPRPGPTMAEVFLEFGRPWLKFLGWWRAENEQVPFPEQLERYVTWMRNERGLSPATVYVRSRRIAKFLRWYGPLGMPLVLIEDRSRLLDASARRSGCLFRRLRGTVVAGVRRDDGYGPAGISAIRSLDRCMSPGTIAVYLQSTAIRARVTSLCAELARGPQTPCQCCLRQPPRCP